VTCNVPGELDEKNVRVPRSFIVPFSTHSPAQAFEGSGCYPKSAAIEPCRTHGFSMWLAGGGFKGGMTFGATDDFGHHAVQDVVNHYDYQATLMHRFGLDHRRLVYARNGQQMTMTDNQPARVVQELLING
jgi:Protein of unknown function (DUF1501)